MAEETLNGLDSLEIFREDVRNILKLAEAISEPKERVRFYIGMAEHYQHLARIDGIREEAKKISSYLLTKSKDFERKLK